MSQRFLRAALTLVLAASLGASAHAAAPKVFSQPEEAAASLAAAVKAGDRKTALAVLGSASKPWVITGDAPLDKAEWEAFAAAYDQQHTVVEFRDGVATLIIGVSRYPFPFPIVKVPGGWRFDPAQGREEILNRRIGENELSTIAVLHEVALAEDEYSLSDHNDNGINEYAGRFASSPGKRDGLFWPTAEGEAKSPLGPLLASAEAQGYTKASGAKSFHGYRYRMLAGQGPAASGGARAYTANGVQIGGWAVLAWPARYGISGIKSFLINQDGTIYESDLGPNTTKAAEAIKLFDPGKGWSAMK